MSTNNPITLRHPMKIQKNLDEGSPLRTPLPYTNLLSTSPSFFSVFLIGVAKRTKKISLSVPANKAFIIPAAFPPGLPELILFRKEYPATFQMPSACLLIVYCYVREVYFKHEHKKCVHVSLRVKSLKFELI